MQTGVYSFALVNFVLVTLAALITLVTLVSLYRGLKRLGEEAAITSRVKEEVERYVLYLLKHEHPEAVTLLARLAKLSEDHRWGESKMDIWKPDARIFPIQALLNRWKTTRFFRSEDVILLGVAFAAMLFNWIAGYVDLFGSFTTGYIMVVICGYLSLDDSLKSSRALIAEYRGALLLLKTPFIFEQEVAAEASLPSEDLHTTDSAGTRWTIPRAD